MDCISGGLMVRLLVLVDSREWFGGGYCAVFLSTTQEIRANRITSWDSVPAM
jgi:hypothetical protein